MGNKHSSKAHQADRSISWQPDPGWINGGPRRRASFTYPSDPTISQLNGFAPPPFLWPPPFPPAPYQNDHHSPGDHGDMDSSKLGSVAGRYHKKESKKTVKSGSKPEPTDSGYFTQGGNMTDSEKSARAKLRGSRLSLNEAAFAAAQTNGEEFHMGPEPNGLYRHPTFNYPASPVVESLYLPFIPPPSDSFKQSSNKGGKKRRWKKSSKKEAEYHQVLFGHYGARPGQMGPYGAQFLPGQRSKSIDDFATQGMLMPYSMGGPYTGAPMGGVIPPQANSSNNKSKRSSSVFDVSEIRCYNDIATHTLNSPQPDGLEFQKPGNTGVETKPKGLEMPHSNGDVNHRPVEKKKSAEIPSSPTESKSISDTSGGQQQIVSRAEVVKISPEAKKTMERNAILLGLESDVGLIPMPECTAPPAVKQNGQDVEFKLTQQQKTEQIRSDVISNKITQEINISSVADEKAEEIEIQPSVRTVLPRQKVAKPQDFDTLSAWKNIPVHSSYNKLNFNNQTAFDKDVIEERLNVKLVPTPPSKTDGIHGGEPIYLEHGERLPEFKKRLIETGSFDFAEKNLAYSEEKSSWQNKSLNGRSIDKDLNLQTPAIPAAEMPLKLTNDANNNSITTANVTLGPSDLSLKRKEKVGEGKGSMRNLKTSITNLFQRSRNPSEKSKTSELFTNYPGVRAKSQEQMDRSRFNSIRSATPSMSLARPGDSSDIDFSWVYDLESKFRREKDTLDRQMDTIRQRGIYQGPPKPLVFSQEELRATQDQFQLPRAHTSLDYNRRTPQPYGYSEEPGRNCVSRNSERIEEFSNRGRRPESVRNFSPEYSRSEVPRKPQSVRNFSPEFISGRSDHQDYHRRPESVRNFSPDYNRSAADLSFTELRGQSTPALHSPPRRGLTVYKRLENEVVGEESFDSPPITRRYSNFGPSPVRLNRIATLATRELEANRFTPSRSPANHQRVPTPVLVPFENHVKLKAAIFEQEAKKVNEEMDTRRQQITRLKYKPSRYEDDNFNGPNEKITTEPFIPQPDYYESSQSNNLGPNGYPTAVGSRRNGGESSVVPNYRRLGSPRSPTPSISADQARDELMDKVAKDNRATLERSQRGLDRRYSSEFIAQSSYETSKKPHRSQYVSETRLNRPPISSPSDRNGFGAQERRSYFDDKLQNFSSSKVYSRPLGSANSPRASSGGVRQSQSQVYSNGYARQFYQ